MAEFDSSSFLLELDSFGRPPPPQKLTSQSTKELATKLDMINMQKQQKMKDELLVPSNKGMVQLGANSGPRIGKQTIDVQDTNKWRNDVLRNSRPVNSRVTPQTVDSAKEYVNKLRTTTTTPGSIADYLPRDDSDDEGRNTRSSSAANSLPSPPSELNVHTKHERKSSDYSSSSSQKSPSPPSHSSYSDYASLYKSTTSTPSPSVIHEQNFNAAFRNSGTIPVVSVQTDMRFSPVAQKSSDSSAFNSPVRSSVGSKPSYSTSLMNQMKVNDKPPPGRAPAFRSTSSQPDPRRQETWRQLASKLDSQDKQFQELAQQLHKDLVLEKRNIVGNCFECKKPMYDSEDRYTVQGNMYHRNCFVCDVCGKELKDQQFYQHNDRFFCKQDYLNEQMLPKKETLCAACKEPIDDMILTALNRSYHPRCFVCSDCGCCLDGIPFSLGKDNKVYCLNDYHNRFAPRCSTCKQAITPQKDTGETVRIVVRDNSYHLECYVCEGCGLLLSEDPDARCYPLGDHLLCKSCHILWADSGSPPPITDL